jgi:uncharacterized protein (TIGR02231 family)
MTTYLNIIKYRLWAFCLILLCPLFLQAQTTLVEGNPTEVTVFLSGAEIKHQNDLKLVAGYNEFKFIGLPSSITPNSISFHVGENVKIVSMAGEINYQGRQSLSKAAKNLEDSVTYFQDELTKLNNELALWETEKKLLQANQNRIGGNDGVSVIDLQTFTTYYRTRMKEINEKSAEQNKKITQLKKVSDKVFKAFEKIKAKEATPTFELNLLLNAKEAKNITLKWSYVVSNAGWSTTYDIRAKGIDKPIQFTYKGNVYNNSGVDWNKVKLKLSTADVMKNATPPYLTSWKLNYETDYYQNNNMIQQQQMYQTNNMNISIDESNNESFGDDASISRAASVALSDVAVSELSTEFEIKEPYTIPSDNRAYAVEINEYELKADYNYVSTPKLDKDAFLLAKILGWESLNLIEGEANVYYHESYVGKSYINLRNADDTLNISLGRDKKVIVNRIKKQEFSSKKFLSSSLTETFSYELTVRNTNTMPIYLELKDQVPVSANSEIEVEILDVSGAMVNKENGLLFWKVNLAAAESKTYKLSYAIKYPKGKKVNLQRVKMQRQYKK